jgi:hypothetical protein
MWDIGSNFSVGISAPDALATNSYKLVLPTDVGSAGQALKIGSVTGSGNARVVTLVWG